MSKNVRILSEEGDPYPAMFKYPIFPTKIGKMQFGPTYSDHSNPSDGQVIGEFTH